MSADSGSPGYDTDYDPNPDPHDPGVGSDPTDLRYRELPRELTSARTVSDLVETVRLYGWLPVFLAVLVHGLFRGVFEHTAEPFAMAHGYVFEGWQIALGVNLLYGFFLTVFVWFLYFGVVGAFAGLLSDESVMEIEVFRVGGYLLLAFVPLLAVSSVLAFTVPPSAAVAGENAQEVIRAHRAVTATPQMRIAGTVLAAGWVVVGFLMLPIVSELYDLGRRASLASVLPVTLVAIVATVLV